MRKSLQLQLLTDAAEWENWDIVLELDQREGDPAPRINYTSMNFIVDWGNGQSDTVATWSSTARDHVGPALEPGIYTAKIRITRGSSGVVSRLVFGAVNGTASTTAKMPQLKRILKCDVSQFRTLTHFVMKCPRLESVCKITGCANIVNFSYSFNYCINLQGTLHLDDTRNATNTSYLAGYSQIEKVVLGGGIPNSITLANAFTLCNHLIEADLGDISSVQSMSQVFNRCSRLERIIWSGIPESCTTLQDAFPLVPGLVDVQIGRLPNCTTMANAFYSCPNLKTLQIGNAPICTIINAFCYSCRKLEEVTIDFSGSTLGSIYQAFFNCLNLKRINGQIRLAPTGPGSSTGYTYLCNGCSNLENIPEMYPVGGFTVLSIPAAQFTYNFHCCVSLKGTAPEWMWTEWPGTGNKTNCFAFCFGLDNYDEIPTSYTNGQKF